MRSLCNIIRDAEMKETYCKKKTIFFFFLIPSFQAEKIFAIHAEKCPQIMNVNSNSNSLQLSVDGVKECKSSSVSLEVFSSRHLSCRTVYPHKIVRPLNKYKGIDNKKHFSDFLNDIMKCEKKIEHFIADNLKRAFAREALIHSSNFPCEYCMAKGVSIVVSQTIEKENIDMQLKLIDEKLASSENDIEKNNLIKVKNALKKSLTFLKKKKITWPFSTSNGEPRTSENILEIVNNIQNLTKEEKKGIKGRSLLLNIPSFNIVRDSPG